MTTFESIDLSDLDRVTGGQTRSTEAEGTISTPGGSATVRAGQQTNEPNSYLRCLDLVGRQGGDDGVAQQRRAPAAGAVRTAAPAAAAAAVISLAAAPRPAGHALDDRPRRSGLWTFLSTDVR